MTANSRTTPPEENQKLQPLPLSLTPWHGTGSKLVYLGGVPGAAGAEVRELSGLQMPALTWDPATGHRAQLQGHAAVAISRAKVLTFG